MNEAQLSRFNAFMAEFQDETDRGAALVGAALIDQMLKETLEAFLVDGNASAELLEDGNGPLGTFSARTKAAFCLGLIASDEYHECNLIRKIRNKFAHALHGTSFHTGRIVELCLNLKLVFPVAERREQGRQLFTYSVFVTAMGLHHRCMQAAEERRAIRPINPVLQLDAVLPPWPPKDA
jgi:hypothetical protein